MATTKNITMKQFNGTDYDTLYPKTIASQIPDVYSKTEVLTSETLTKYGLTADKLPNDVFQQIKVLIDNVQSNANSRAKFQTGSYVGTGTYGASNPCSLTFDFVPEYIVVIPNVQYNVAVGSNGNGDYYGESAPAVFFNGGSKYTVWLSWTSSGGTNSGTKTINYNVNDNVLSWYINFSSGYKGPAGAQMNNSGTSYFYYAFGK